MTPSALRQRAIQNLRSARALLDVQDADNANQLAGHAAELLLKARFCSKNGVSQFPETRAALREAKLVMLATHSLDELLMLCDGLHFDRCSEIDWESAAAWLVEDRYKPTGTRSASEVLRQLNATELLAQTLVEYELVEGIQRMRQAIEISSKAALAVAAIEKGANGGFTLLISATLTDGVCLSAESIADQLPTFLDEDLRPCLSSIALLPAQGMRSKALQALHHMFPGVVLVEQSVVGFCRLEYVYLVGPEPVTLPHRASVKSCSFNMF